MNPLLKLTTVPPLAGFKPERTTLINPSHIIKVEDNVFDSVADSIKITLTDNSTYYCLMSVDALDKLINARK